jgi:hypothetical protein
MMSSFGGIERLECLFDGASFGNVGGRFHRLAIKRRLRRMSCGNRG